MYKQQANMPKQIEEQIERLCKQQSENKRLEQTMSATEADLAQVSLSHTPSPGLSLSHTHMSATEADLAQVSLSHTPSAVLPLSHTHMRATEADLAQVAQSYYWY